jgi:hypothetical protein
MRCVAGLVIGLWTLAPGPGPTVARGADGKDKCEGGPDGAVTMTLGMQGQQCVVVEPVAAACVDRGNSIRWTLVNRDCDFDESQTAIEISQPKPKGGQKAFKYESCTPKKNGWKKGTTAEIKCKVPKDADEGLYKYDVSGQVKTLDPDIEVRRGGGGD